MQMATNKNEEFLRRFEQHILPSRLVKIRHSGFLSPAYKNNRLATIAQQLALPPRTPKVKLPVTLLATMRYGVDITQCKYCTAGKMQLIATYIFYNFSLVDVKEFKARGSPSKHK
jgi:Putative transposase